jgi:16S rRNA (cytidine1402-2'-O)-methyltransferase
MISYYEHNKLIRLERVLAALVQGDVALVSEAGTPLLSDPGYELVQAALAEGFDVVSIPGPSALTAVLPASGLPPDRFLFLGFLPRKAAERRRLFSDVASEPGTLVCFESPHRLPAALADLADMLGGERKIAVCRELTKLYEEIWRGTLAEARQEWTRRQPRGEFTLVVAGAGLPAAWSEAQVTTALTEALDSGLTAKAAVQQITAQSGWPKRKVYALAQQIRS